MMLLTDDEEGDWQVEKDDGVAICGHFSNSLSQKDARRFGGRLSYCYRIIAGQRLFWWIEWWRRMLPTIATIMRTSHTTMLKL